MKFKHYLNFLDLPLIGKIEISETIGFDKSSYKVKRDSKRFGRDLIIANEDSELVFSRDFFEQMEVTQMLPDGTIIDYASQGFDFLLDVFQNEGWESRIEYILEKDGNSFTTGIFSYATAVVEFDNISVKIIQNTKREIIKRLEDTDIDAFSSVALDDRTITPCSTTNILLKAKPIQEISSWSMLGARTLIVNNDDVNPFMNLNRYDIRSSFTPFEESTFDNIEAIRNFRYIKANTDLSNGTGEIYFNGILKYRPGGNSNTDASFRLLMLQYDGIFQIGDPLIITEIFRKAFSGGSNADFSVDENFVFDLPNLNINQSLTFYWKFSAASTGVIGSNSITFNQYSMDLKYSSTAIDTVVKGIRVINLMKHNLKSITDMPLIAPIYDEGGEHYDNFAMNGLLLGQITDKPFYNQFGDLMNIPLEVCADYQINENNVEILPYSDYYKDIQIAEFEELPSLDAQTKMNKLYSIKTALFKYKKSSTDRETNGENSIDDVHTETQKYISNMVDGNLKVEINHIRSAFLIEQARQRAFDTTQTKTLENDNNLFLLDCIPLSPSSKGGFGAVLLMQINDSGHLQILNNNLEGDGIYFNWTLLGFTVGSQFFIDEGENAGTWQVISITSSVLTLFPISVSATFEGEAFITVSYYFTGVLYTNRTNEGFTLIEGVANHDKYSNLNYSWARNINRWKSYLATATKFKPNGIIKTASFINNGNLVTKKTGEINSIADMADIVNSEIAQYKILNPFVHTIKVYSDFEKTTQLIRDIAIDKGYISVRLNDGRTIKGFVNDMDYEWLNEELTLEVEEKFISDFMEITNNKITLTGYDDKDSFSSFKINNNYVLLFSADDTQLFPPTRFNLVKINGVIFTDLTAFSDALITLLDE